MMMVNDGEILQSFLLVFDVGRMPFNDVESFVLDKNFFKTPTVVGLWHQM